MRIKIIAGCRETFDVHHPSTRRSFVRWKIRCRAKKKKKNHWLSEKKKRRVGNNNVSRGNDETFGKRVSFFFQSDLGGMGDLFRRKFEIEWEFASIGIYV